MTRGRKKKFKIKVNIKPDTARTVIAVLFILLALITLISFFAPEYALNEKIQAFWRGLFGFPSILVVVVLTMAGLVFIQPLKSSLKEPRVVIGVFLLLITLSGIFHIFLPFDSSYELAKDGKGGGIIGYQVANLLIKTVSKYGGVAVLFSFIIISLVIIFDISLDRILRFFNGNEEEEGFIEKIKKILHRESIPNDEPEIETNYDPTQSVEESSSKVPAHSTEDSHIEVGPSFEVIPSISEPLDGMEPGVTHITKGKQTPTPSLPYVDRVWQYPSFDLLTEAVDNKVDAGDIDVRKQTIVEALKSFGIESQVVEVKAGPSVTQYAVKLEEGTRVAAVASLQNDLALALASPTGSVRIEAPIPGKSHIGIEVPNNKRAIVNFKSLVNSDAMKGLKSKIGIVLGKDVGGRVHVYDIGKMPHMLIAGTTGSGKSVFLHNVLFSILFRASPQEVKFIMIDPKRVELSHYQDIPHLLSPVVTDMEKAPSVFKWAAAEMDKRYQLLESARVKNIESYNEKSGFQAMSYIIIVIDELADLMVQDPAGIEKNIIRIAQKARAVGIHLLLAMQRPDANVITGLIKANIPCRVAFKVTSVIDSRVILDQTGAEKLLGQGDMLFVPPDSSKPVRLQGGFVTDSEIASLVNFLKEQGMEPDYRNEVLEMSDKSGSAPSNWGG